MILNNRKAVAKSFLGKVVYIKIDRPIGYVHKKMFFSLTYPVNYGYIPDVIGGDGEEIDVYLLGVDKPVTEFTAQIIAIIHRENDVEDKLVGVPVGYEITEEEIAQAVDFQEKFFKTYIEVLK